MLYNIFVSNYIQYLNQLRILCKLWRIRTCMQFLAFNVIKKIFAETIGSPYY